MFLHRGCCCEDKPEGCGSGKPIKVSAIYNTHPDIAPLSSSFEQSMRRAGRGSLDSLNGNGDVDSVSVLSFNPNGDGGGGSVSSVSTLKNSCLIFCGFSARYFCDTQTWPADGLSIEEARVIIHDLRNIALPTDFTTDEGGNIQNECLAGIVHAVAVKGATLVVVGGSSLTPYSYDVPVSVLYQGLNSDLSQLGVNKINNFLQFLDTHGSQYYGSSVSMRIPSNVTFPPDALGGTLASTSINGTICQVGVGEFTQNYAAATLGQIVSVGAVDIDGYEISVRQEHGGGVGGTSIGVQGIGYAEYGKGNVIVTSSARTFAGLISADEARQTKANTECQCAFPPDVSAVENDFPVPDSPNPLYMDSTGPDIPIPSGPHWLSAWCKKFVMKGDVGELFE